MISTYIKLYQKDAPKKTYHLLYTVSMSTRVQPMTVVITKYHKFTNSDFIIRNSLLIPLLVTSNVFKIITRTHYAKPTKNYNELPASVNSEVICLAPRYM